MGVGFAISGENTVTWNGGLLLQASNDGENWININSSYNSNAVYNYNFNNEIYFRDINVYTENDENKIIAYFDDETKNIDLNANDLVLYKRDLDNPENIDLENDFTGNMIKIDDNLWKLANLGKWGDLWNHGSPWNKVIDPVNKYWTLKLEYKNYDIYNYIFGYGGCPDNIPQYLGNSWLSFTCLPNTKDWTKIAVTGYCPNGSGFDQRIELRSRYLLNKDFINSMASQVLNYTNYPKKGDIYFRNLELYKVDKINIDLSLIKANNYIEFNPESTLDFDSEYIIDIPKYSITKNILSNLIMHNIHLLEYPLDSNIMYGLYTLAATVKHYLRLCSDVVNSSTNISSWCERHILEPQYNGSYAIYSLNTTSTKYYLKSYADGSCGHAFSVGNYERWFFEKQSNGSYGIFAFYNNEKHYLRVCDGTARTILEVAGQCEEFYFEPIDSNNSPPNSIFLCPITNQFNSRSIQFKTTYTKGLASDDFYVNNVPGLIKDTDNFYTLDNAPTEFTNWPKQIKVITNNDSNWNLYEILDYSLIKIYKSSIYNENIFILENNLSIESLTVISNNSIYLNFNTNLLENQIYKIIIPSNLIKITDAHVYNKNVIDIIFNSQINLELFKSETFYLSQEPSINYNYIENYSNKDLILKFNSKSNFQNININIEDINITSKNRLSNQENNIKIDKIIYGKAMRVINPSSLNLLPCDFTHTNNLNFKFEDTFVSNYNYIKKIRLEVNNNQLGAGVNSSKRCVSIVQLNAYGVNNENLLNINNTNCIAEPQYNNWEAQNAVDDDLLTFMHTTPGYDGYLEIELDESTLINKLRIQQRPDYTWLSSNSEQRARIPTRIKLYNKNDEIVEQIDIDVTTWTTEIKEFELNLNNQEAFHSMGRGNLGEIFNNGSLTQYGPWIKPNYFIMNISEWNLENNYKIYIPIVCSYQNNIYEGIIINAYINDNWEKFNNFYIIPNGQASKAHWLIIEYTSDINKFEIINCTDLIDSNTPNSYFYLTYWTENNKNYIEPEKLKNTIDYYYSNLNINYSKYIWIVNDNFINIKFKDNNYINSKINLTFPINSIKSFFSDVISYNKELNIEFYTPISDPIFDNMLIKSNTAQYNDHLINSWITIPNIFISPMNLGDSIGSNLEEPDIYFYDVNDQLIFNFNVNKNNQIILRTSKNSNNITTGIWPYDNTYSNMKTIITKDVDGWNITINGKRISDFDYINTISTDVYRIEGGEYIKNVNYNNWEYYYYKKLFKLQNITSENLEYNKWQYYWNDIIDDPQVVYRFTGRSGSKYMVYRVHPDNRLPSNIISDIEIKNYHSTLGGNYNNIFHYNDNSFITNLDSTDQFRKSATDLKFDGKDLNDLTNDIISSDVNDDKFTYNNLIFRYSDREIFFGENGGTFTDGGVSIPSFARRLDSRPSLNWENYSETTLNRNLYYIIPDVSNDFSTTITPRYGWERGNNDIGIELFKGNSITQNGGPKLKDSTQNIEINVNNWGLVNGDHIWIAGLLHPTQGSTIWVAVREDSVSKIEIEEKYIPSDRLYTEAEFIIPNYSNNINSNDIFSLNDMNQYEGVNESGGTKNDIIIYFRIPYFKDGNKLIKLKQEGKQWPKGVVILQVLLPVLLPPKP